MDDENTQTKELSEAIDIIAQKLSDDIDKEVMNQIIDESLDTI